MEERVPAGSPGTTAPAGEDRLIGWLRGRLSRQGRDLLGDDAAFLSLSGAFAVTLDQQIAGVHFPDDLAPGHRARRLLAVNLSDLAACGAVPRHAFLALSAPTPRGHRAFLAALLAACRAAGVTLAGGDLARGPVWAATLVLLGRPGARGRWVRRGAGHRQDVLWAGGTLGESAAGRLLLERGAGVAGRAIRLPAGLPRRLHGPARRAVRRHLAPEPQLALGCWLGRQSRAAAIDVSDGLALDLHRLARESRTGAVIEAAELPQPPELGELARALDHDALELALAGGEDYVLLFALPPGIRPPARFGSHPIGRLGDAAGLRLRGLDGRVRRLPPRGWDHLAGRA